MVEFAAGLLAASLFWFVFFSTVMVWFVLSLYKNVETQVERVKVSIEQIRWALNASGNESGAVDAAITRALESADAMIETEAA